jgi:hypothetical protein
MKRILVQAGHMRPLQPGHEGQTGARGEAELVADIQHALVRLLNDDPEHFHGIPMPGLIDDSVHVDGALFLHADGNNNAAARGFSVGFPLFDVNSRLAHLIAAEIEKIPGHPPRRADNNTIDMAHYYGFGHVDTPGPEVIIEHGFTTNPAEHEWLKRHVEQLAQAELNALRTFFGFQAGHNGVSDTPAHVPAGVPAAVTPGLSVDSTLLSPPRAPAPRVVRFLLAGTHGEYSEEDVRGIVQNYYIAAQKVGLDPLLVIAQMVEETGHLTSFWSQRPRRNLAGIGVTGAPGVGISFPDLHTAVRAHTGRLLAYALPRGSENSAQLELIDEALSFRPLPASKRGAAPTLAGLAGSWAIDPNYAVKIAHVANEIRTLGARTSSPVAVGAPA